MRHCASGLEEMDEHTYNLERVRSFWSQVKKWTIHIEPKQLLLLDVGYVMDNIGERVESLVILAVARIVIWLT